MRHFPIKYITELADIAGRYRPGGNFYSTPSVKQASTHMQQIRQYFEKLVTMTDTDWDLFSSGLNGRNLPKNSGSYRPSYSPAATDYGVVADSVFSADASGQHIRFGKAGEL